MPFSAENKPSSGTCSSFTNRFTSKNTGKLRKMVPGMHHMKLPPLVSSQGTESEMARHRLRTEFFAALVEQSIHRFPILSAAVKPAPHRIKPEDPAARESPAPARDYQEEIYPPRCIGSTGPHVPA